MPRYVKLPNGKYLEWPDGVSAADFKAKASRIGGVPQDNGPSDPSGRTPTGKPATGDERNELQRSLDNMTTPDPRREEWQGPVKTGIDRFAQGVAGNVLPLISHPIDSAIGIGKSIGKAASESGGDPQSFMANMARPMVEGAVRNIGENGPAKAIPNIAGQAVGAAATGELTGGALRAIPKVGSAIRTAAIGDPDVAALKALRIGSGSPKGLSTIRAVEGARPYLQGAKNLEELQGKIPAAKGEIWGPYQKTIDAIKGKPVNGPSGPTTVGELEQERLQTSALNRALKQQKPEAIQLAQQKGMTQAELLQHEKAIQQALDPHLEEAGIDPRQIRQTFGQVAQVGEKVSGRTTLPEKPQPYGLGKVLSSNPFTSAPGKTISNIGQGVRDVAAGRPIWSGRPTDVAVKDAFRIGGEKPDFRAPLSGMAPFQRPSLQLPSGTIANADILQDQRALGSGFERKSSAINSAAPPSRLALPSSTGGGESQPMIGVLKHPGAMRDFQAPTDRISPANFSQRPSPTPSAPNGFRVGPNGETIRNPRGLLTGAQEVIPPPADTTAHTFPAGSALRGNPETPFYPPGSLYRKPGPSPWTQEEMDAMNRKGTQ